MSESSEFRLENNNHLSEVSTSFPYNGVTLPFPQKSNIDFLEQFNWREKQLWLRKILIYCNVMRA